MALYRGPLSEGDNHVDEDFITTRAAANSEFWKYVDAKQREGKISAKSGEVYRFKLSIKFLDSQGNACLVDPAGGETFKTVEDFEFYRSGDRADEGAGSTLKNSNKSVRSVAKSASKAARAIAKAHTEPFRVAMEIIKGDQEFLRQQLKDFQTRSDSATKAIMRTLENNKAEPETDWVTTSKNVVDLFATVKKTFIN